jgi:hypothetical protein
MAKVQRRRVLLEIKPTKQFNQFQQVYGREIKERYQWFLYEFGKRVTRTFLKHLKTEISAVKGTKEYRKRLIIAEIRDKGKKSWFAVTAIAKGMQGANPKETILEVVARFKRHDDPAYAILEQMGPWTADTLPFIPSERQGQVVMRKAKPAEVETLREVNFALGEKLTSKMVRFGLEFTPRDKIYEDLKVVKDIEIQALSIEFGMAKDSKPHWRPSLRWIKMNVSRVIMKDRDLFRVWYDPSFRKYRVRRTLKVKLNTKDLKRMQEFQDKVRV